MAVSKIGYFDEKGNFFRTPTEATLSDLASMLGKVGDGESLAPGIAKMLMEKRDELERIFEAHDKLLAEAEPEHEHAPQPELESDPEPESSDIGDAELVFADESIAPETQNGDNAARYLYVD
jgi:hypothetical protein